VEVCDAVVEACFVPYDFNEALPLYILDLGGRIAVLFGQWLSDPHTLVVEEKHFENWKQNSFFRGISVRSLRATGLALQCRITDTELIQATRLPAALTFLRLQECEFIESSEMSVVQALNSAGLVAPI
jgi:hypothetical protein